MTIKLLQTHICGCEHINHCGDGGAKPGHHEYGKATAGMRAALYVGPVCDPCAEDCMKDYLFERVHSCIECWECFVSAEYLLEHTHQSHPELVPC